MLTLFKELNRIENKTVLLDFSASTSLSVNSLLNHRTIIEVFEGDVADEHFFRYTRGAYIISGRILYRFVPELGYEDPQLLVPQR